MTSPSRWNAEGLRWRDKIADAVGPRIATVAMRQRFAEALLRRLATAIPEAFEAREVGRPDARRRLHEVVRRTRRVLRELREELARPALVSTAILVGQSEYVAQQFHARAYDHEAPRWDRDVELQAVETFLEALESRITQSTPSARGVGRPPNMLGIVLAEAIADVWHRSFGSVPSHANTPGGGKRGPFDRVVQVVEEWLAWTRRDLPLAQRRVSISAEARREGIARLAAKVRRKSSATRNKRRTR